jgi:hypothetical protein
MGRAESMRSEEQAFRTWAHVCRTFLAAALAHQHPDPVMNALHSINEGAGLGNRPFDKNPRIYPALLHLRLSANFAHSFELLLNDIIGYYEGALRRPRPPTCVELEEWYRTAQGHRVDSSGGLLSPQCYRVGAALDAMLVQERRASENKKCARSWKSY